MSNPVLPFKVETDLPEEGSPYPSYRELLSRLASQLTVSLETSGDQVWLPWVGPSAPPSDLTGRALWFVTDDQNRILSLKISVNGAYVEMFPGHRQGDLMYRVPSATDDGPWKLADGTNGTSDLSSTSGYQLGAAKLHEFVGVTIP